MTEQLEFAAPKLILGVMYAPPGAIKDAGVFDSITRLGSPFLIGGIGMLSTNCGTISQIGRCRPSTIDFFITDFHANFECRVTEDFDTPHRPVILTANTPIGSSTLDQPSTGRFCSYMPVAREPLLRTYPMSPKTPTSSTITSYFRSSADEEHFEEEVNSSVRRWCQTR